ncbi:MAG: lycopene cyclase family protein [Ilumatobacter sp.]
MNALRDRAAADVVVVGDGPAGSALAAALRARNVDVLLVGPNLEWRATYTTWIDDVDDAAVVRSADIWAHQLDAVRVRFEREMLVERPYGVIDNAALRRHLRLGVRHEERTIGSVGQIDARLVIDATGWPSQLTGSTRNGQADATPTAWQTAFGVVLSEPPSGPLAEPTMMDFSDAGASIVGREEVVTFAYSFPVVGGWLVEETVLAAEPAVPPDQLAPLLATRLGLSLDELLLRAVTTESVQIPMGTPIPIAAAAPSGLPPVVCFGATAGMVHPATGYSLASSLRAADRVAEAIQQVLDATSPTQHIDVASVRRAVWPTPSRRTRQLHDYGLDVLLRLDAAGVRSFFGTFFEMDTERWTGYLRIDTPPRRLAGIMTSMFRRASWRLRARLMTGNPLRLLRTLRP